MSPTQGASGAEYGPLDGPADVTRLLGELRRGDPIPEAVTRRIYKTLRMIAQQHRRRWKGNETLNTTALVHEAYLKLFDGASDFENRDHFLAVASTAMRHLLVNYAERQSAQKRGGGQPDLPLEEALLVPAERAEELIALDEALKRLEAVDERAARVVECRFFTGLSAEETASALGLSRRTVTRDWRTARAWLYDELQRDLLGSL